MTTRGTPGPTCGAKTRKPGNPPCQNPPVEGATRCPKHGGLSPQAQTAAKERLALAQAQRDVALFGARRDIHPADALLELVHWTAGEVDYWRARVRQLDEHDLTWGLTKSKTGGDDRGDTYEAKPNIAYGMLIDASKRLEAHCVAALRAGVEERALGLQPTQERNGPGGAAPDRR